MRTDLATRFAAERLPRYTSYPTAPHFSTAIPRGTYGTWLASVPKGISGSLYVHIPFCRSMCWYCGCHTSITSYDAPIADYLGVLAHEIDLVAEAIGDPPLIRHLHFGGGTPTIMKPESFLELAALIKARFPFAGDAEIAVEIDPRTLDKSMTAVLGAAGVTRASLGVQTLDPMVQHAINRMQTLEQITRTTEDLRTAGISGVNFDLIYGLPHQTVSSCLDTVSQCVNLCPDRFAVFGYAHVPEFKKHQRKIDEIALPDSSARFTQAEAIADLLTMEGYRRIGFDHFALAGDKMTLAQANGQLHRNFQGYTTDPGDILIGFGASAIGRLAQGYVQNEIFVPRYAKRIARDEFAIAKGYTLTAEDRLRADVIERLMCDFRVDLETVCRKHSMPPELLLKGNERLRLLLADGLVRMDGPLIQITDNPHLLVRGVAAAFDNHLASSSRPYSRAI